MRGKVVTATVGSGSLIAVTYWVLRMYLASCQFTFQLPL